MNDVRSRERASEASEHPRPQVRRAGWWSLNGPWAFAVDKNAQLRRPEDVRFERIEVPFSLETPASGVGDTGFFSALWYRREFDVPSLPLGGRLLLHFGAVDYHAQVWVNGVPLASHEGGYTPFSMDVTDVLRDGPQVVVVRAFDDPLDLAKPRGKQDWLLEAHSVWYPRTSGIWQEVWLEPVPATRIDSVQWTPNLESWTLGLHALVSGEPRDGLRMQVRLTVQGQTLCDDAYSVTHGEVDRRIAPSDPGIDDSRNTLLWSPSNPTLIEARLQLWAERGELLDEVQSYTALRSVAVQGDRFLLNGRVYPLRMVLDQGYWPETGLSAPSGAALRKDVELAKAMGFNGVRKHQKMEDPRYLYWADHLGLMVWEEMPSAYRFTNGCVERLARQWMEAMRRDRSHPCIVALVPFNESWGVPDLPAIAAQRHYVQSLYHLTKTLDRQRPVVGNDGWESAATDIIGIHDYDDGPERLAQRYGRPDMVPQLFRHGRPGGRVLTLEGHPHAGQPIMLTEFGGIRLEEGGAKTTWGYSTCRTKDEFKRQYSRLLEVVRSSQLLAGFCHTQFTDTYQEANGLLYADRTPKLPLEDIAKATRGW